MSRQKKIQNLGRPPIESESRSKWIHLRVTPSLYTEIAKAAGGTRRMSDWVRSAARRALADDNKYPGETVAAGDAGDADATACVRLEQ
jgi:hypothetical protein